MLIVICIFVHFVGPGRHEIWLMTNCQFQDSNRKCIKQNKVGSDRVLEYFVDGNERLL